MGEVIAKPKPENNIPQPSIEHTPPHQPIENNEGVIYDTELEHTLKNMKNITEFFEINENPKCGWIRNGYHIKKLGGTQVEIYDEKNNMTPGNRKVLVDSSYNTAKSLNDIDKVIFRHILQKTKYYTRVPTKRRLSGCDGS